MSHLDRLYCVVGYDVDGIAADFPKGFYKYMGQKQPSKLKEWSDPFIEENFSCVLANNDFWLNLPLLNKYEGQKIDVYITSRPCPSWVTRLWLMDNGWPDRPVLTVGHDQSKVAAAKMVGLTHFIDDKPQNVIELHEIRVHAVLYEPYYLDHSNCGIDFISGKLPLNPFTRH